MNRRSFLADVFAAAALAWGAPLMRRMPKVPVPPAPALSIGDYVLGRGIVSVALLDSETGKPTGPWKQIGTTEGFAVRIEDPSR